MAFRETARRYGPLALGLGALALFFALKNALYANLEYLGDIFSALQMSRGFAWGRPLLYENAMGRHAAAHNYYLLPFFFPLTSWLHGRGLFLGLLLL
ncbi:MAG TPA: hypothetical protein VGR00_01435, partial [Thermoanaerobaculia bacterium]|nr:hypothetical protein [Thermoanaerobaculia bacterium]